MNQIDIARVKSIFCEAVALSGPERRALLDRACDGNAPWPRFLQRVETKRMRTSQVFLHCIGPVLWCGMVPVMTFAEVGDRLPRVGDEIVVCGQLYHTTAPVVLWMDPGGYDAYRVERRFAPLAQSDWQFFANQLESPNRYGMRGGRLSAEEVESLRGGGWDLPTLQKVVDQFVMHYDVCGTSRRCFQVLHDARTQRPFHVGHGWHDLSDVGSKGRAWHATTSNSRSIGVEIAQIGAYPPEDAKVLDEWYPPDDQQRPRIRLPQSLGDGGVRTAGFVGYPARKERVRGIIQGRELVQYDFTPQQYDSLIKLTATLCRVFPQLRCDYPRDERGQLVREKLPDERLEIYQGLLGHFHVQTNKIDPGPAFQWDRLVTEARALMPPSN